MTAVSLSVPLTLVGKKVRFRRPRSLQRFSVFLSDTSGGAKIQTFHSRPINLFDQFPLASDQGLGNNQNPAMWSAARQIPWTFDVCEMFWYPVILFFFLNRSLQTHFKSCEKTASYCLSGIGSSKHWRRLKRMYIPFSLYYEFQTYWICLHFHIQWADTILFKVLSVKPINWPTSTENTIQNHRVNWLHGESFTLGLYFNLMNTWILSPVYSFGPKINMELCSIFNLLVVC